MSKRTVVLMAVLLLASSAFGQVTSSPGVTGGGSGTVAGQVKGQPSVGTGDARTVKSSPQSVAVSEWCGDPTGASCPAQVDECAAINAIITAYNCTISAGGSCNIVDDMIGRGVCGQTLNPQFSGRIDFRTNGAAHDFWLDGMDTFVQPTSSQIHGMGGSSSDQNSMNTRVIACNPATDRCDNGGFTLQNTSATTIGLVVAGANPTATMTITLTAGNPFSISTTAFNAIGTTANPRIGRCIYIVGASTAADNGCHPLLSVTTQTAPQVIVVAADSTTMATCAAPCGSAVASLDTPMWGIWSASNGGNFHGRMGDLILDGHDLAGVGGLVNAAGEEGSGTDGSLQIYNAPAYGFRIEESSAYAGNCFATCGGSGSNMGIGVANHGPYQAISVNFNPFVVSKVGGAACSNSGVGDCAGGLVPVGGKISIGTGAANNFALINVQPRPNPNYACGLFLGAAGNQGGGPFQRITCSQQDKTGTGINQNLFVASGANIPTGLLFIGEGDTDIINSHIEFFQDDVSVCGDPAVNVSWAQAYAGIATYGIKFDTGKWDWGTPTLGILADVGGTGGTQANCADIDFGAIVTNGAPPTSGNILQDNLLTKTIGGSATVQSFNYHHGHGSSNVNWASTDQGVGIGTSTLTLLPGGSPLRDQTRFVLVANMTGSPNTVGLGTTGASNPTFSWPVTAANYYDMECQLPITFAASATLKLALYSVSGAVTVSFANLDTRGNTGAAAAWQDLFTLNAANIGAAQSPVTGAPGAAEMVSFSSQFLTSHAGNIGIEFVGNAANNITMLQGGTCSLVQTN